MGPRGYSNGKGWLEKALATCVLIFKDYLNATWQIFGTVAASFEIGIRTEWMIGSRDEKESGIDK